MRLENDKQLYSLHLSESNGLNVTLGGRRHQRSLDVSSKGPSSAGQKLEEAIMRLLLHVTS